MFTIQYQTASGAHAMQEFNGRTRASLVVYLASFRKPIMAVYEQATVITKAIRAELAKVPERHLSPEAREFAAASSLASSLGIAHQS